jgi:cation diffusion facilitator CzcD-associated flavoprotein CzcO
MARALAERDIEFDVYETLPGLGGIWDISRQQSPIYERTRLISPARLSSFTGFPMPDTFSDYPDHKDILAYLHSFASHHDLHDHMRFSCEVTEIQPTANGWAVTLRNAGLRSYTGVILACGHNWTPRLPDFAPTFSEEAIHSGRYRSPERFVGKSVLVVGGGNSGCDIACDLSGTAAQVSISLRRGYFFLPRYVQGQPTAEWAASPAFSERVLGALLGRQVRLLDPFGVPRPSHHLFESNPVINDEIIDHIVSGEIQVRSDVTRCHGSEVTFVDGGRERFDAVVFATGYEHSLPILGSLVGWDGGRPALHGNLFHPSHDLLFVLGLFETDGSAFPILSAQAAAVARVIHLVERGADRAELWAIVRECSHIDLSGGRRYVDSLRHAISVHRDVYMDYMERLSGRLDAYVRPRS